MKIKSRDEKHFENLMVKDSLGRQRYISNCDRKVILPKSRHKKVSQFSLIIPILFKNDSLMMKEGQ